MRYALAAFTLLVVVGCSRDNSVTGPDLRTARVIEPEVRNPILFVHGWNSSGAVWFPTIDRFITDGYTQAELVNWTYYSAQSNATTAGQLGAKVDSILSVTGAQKVDIITHSMGSLPARYFIKNLGGAAKVDELVTLGGPDHGTNTALFCFQVSCIEMRPNSSFLTALNRKDETPGSPRYGTWRSPCDEVINPQSSPILKGATNTQTACIRHSDLHQNTTVYSQFKAWVE